MISTKELMLGNWVEYATGREEKPTIMALVTTIFSGTVFLDGCLDVEEEGLCGIPITKELLKKCGFTVDHEIENTICFNIEDYYANLVDDTLHLYIKRGNHEVKYLHELQNAYYLLTKKHLEVNL